MAVGAFWVLWGAQLYLSSRNEEALVERLTQTPLLVVEAIMLGSLLLSLLHLGTPVIAYRAVTNLRSSWLSREIFFAVLFTGTSIVFTAMQYWQVGSDGLRSGAAWLAVFFGFMLIYSMSKLYMIRTVPSWNTIYTMISFFLTALILGGLLISVVFVVNTPGEFIPDSSSAYKVVASISGLVLILLGGRFVSILTRIVQMLSGSIGEKESVQGLIEQYKNIFYIRLLMGILGMAFLGFMVFQTRSDPSLYAVCFTLVLVAELLDRYLFYTAREVSGM